MATSPKRSRSESHSPLLDGAAPSAPGDSGKGDSGTDPLRAASFETVMEELQTVVARLEEGELSLEESLSAFELGVKLSREGSRRLEDAERRVDALLASEPSPPDLPSP